MAKKILTRRPISCFLLLVFMVGIFLIYISSILVWSVNRKMVLQGTFTNNDKNNNNNNDNNSNSNRNNNSILYTDINKCKNKRTVFMKDILVFRNMMKESETHHQNLGKFILALTEAQYNTSLEILEIFAKTMEQNNLTYFIYGGTLIGSMRHHGMIPWDDDLDVIVDKRQSKKIWEVLSKLQPHFEIVTVRKQRFWKLFSKHSQYIMSYVSWKWPFLDIWMYVDDGDYIKDWSCPWCNDTYHKKNVFPLKKRPFGPLELYAPSNSEDFLSSVGTWRNDCVSRYWNHKLENEFSKPQIHTPCANLTYFAPFVATGVKNGCVIETLIFKNKTVSTFELN